MTTLAGTRWIPVEPAAFDVDEKVTRRGVEFHVFVSPYDMPEAVRGRFDPARDRFIIEFRYLGDEETQRTDVDEHVTFFVGVRSRRVYQIHADVKGLGASQVALRIEKAIDTLPSRLPARDVPQKNFEVAKRVVHVKQPELLSSLAAAGSSP